MSEAAPKKATYEDLCAIQENMTGKPIRRPASSFRPVKLREDHPI